MSAIDDLREELKTATSNEGSFELLGKLARLFAEAGKAPPELLECVAWLKEREQIICGSSAVYREMVDDICRASGLYQYLSDNPLDFRTRIAKETFRSPSLPHIIFHRPQAETYWDLIEGKNLLLSAPTSFGKSAIVDSLLASGKYASVVIIVPTIALLDETRRRLSRQFQEKYQIIWHRKQAPGSGPIVYIQTQERLLDREERITPDLLVIDEFYKVDPTRGDTERARSLNRAIYKFAPRAKQVYGLGPNIDQLAFQSIGSKPFSLKATRFRTVATEVVDKTGIAEERRLQALKQLLEDLGSEPSVIFTRSPQRAVQIARQLDELGYHRESAWGKNAGALLAQSVHPVWQAGKSLTNGIALHHGRVLRSVAQLQVAAFNAGELDKIICTSTLIEGVNTVAKNVIIFDNRISAKDIDFFTYSNIAGRAGRMMRHYVGKVFVFDEPPVSREVSLELPIFSESGVREFGFEFDVADRDLSEEARQQVADTIQHTGVSRELIARIRDFAKTSPLDFCADVQAVATQNPALFSWQGQPDYRQVRAICELSFKHFGRKRFAAKSPQQAAFFLFRLGFVRGHLPDFLGLFLNWSRKDPPEENIEHGFKFLRDCEFNFPQAFALIHRTLEELFGFGFCDYSSYIVRLESWFLDERVRILEELGIPFFYSPRILRRLPEDVEALAGLANYTSLRSLSPALQTSSYGQMLSVLGN